MAPQIPKTVKQWNVTGQDGFRSLKLSEQPAPEVGPGQVLVKMHAASLNYRDLIIPKGQYPFPVTENVIPGSDGAGEVIAVGRNVRRFKPGDKVVTLFNQGHIGGPIDAHSSFTGLGGALDGTFRTAAVFSEEGLCRLPSPLSYLEAASLPCAAVTAWNSLYGGDPDNALRPGQWVLTQGTGGVSVFAVQFAKAAGARVIATTSSPAKAKLLERLGADHILYYTETKNWGKKAKELTGGVGVDHIVEVAGDKSMRQSLDAIRVSGVITIVGFVGGLGDGPDFIECLSRLCTVRGVLVGSRKQMEDMCLAIEANPEKLRPVIDEKTFKLEQLVEAYEYQWSAKHQGKVCIEIS